MITILVIDLGRFKSVCCDYGEITKLALDTATRLHTIARGWPRERPTPGSWQNKVPYAESVQQMMAWLI
jgi:hypothetical protein